MAKLALLIQRLKGIPQIPFHLPHPLFLVTGPLVVVAQEVEEPVDEESSHLLSEADAVCDRLSLCSMRIYHHIPQQELKVRGHLLHAVIQGKRENIGGPVHVPVDTVKAFHPPVIDEEYPEFSPVKVERCEEFQGVLLYFPEIYPYEPLMILYDNLHQRSGHAAVPPQAPFHCPLILFWVPR